MANLLDSTLPNLNVLGDTEIQGALKRNMPFMSGSKSDGGGAYDTTGVITLNNVTSQGITSSGSRFTITEAGVYATQFWGMNTYNPPTVCRLYIHKNGIAGAQARANGTYDYEGFWVYRLWEADVGDYFEFVLTVGALYAASEYYNRFLIWRVA